MTRKLRVVLTTEGTYPYCTGGVSTWADILVKELSEIEFYILSIMMNPFQAIKFEMPDNVVQLINVPLWGTEEPTEYISGQTFSEIFINKLKPDELIRDVFRDILGEIVCAIYSENPDLDTVGNNLYRLHELFREHDYRKIFRALWVWDFFYELMLQIHDKSPLFTLDEFQHKFSLPVLSAAIIENYHELADLKYYGEIDHLNQIIHLTNFFEIWSTRHGTSELGRDIEKLIADINDPHETKFTRLPLLKQKKINLLNRMLLEKSFKAECPKYLDKPDETPNVYDFVESLRWIYRFFTSLLAPLPEAEVYHSSAAAFSGLPCIVAKLKYGSKFMLTEHGIYVREQYLYASREKIDINTKQFIMGLIGMVSRLNYHFADEILPVCKYNKRWELIFDAKEEKINVIYNGIDTERFRSLVVDRDVRPTVVMIARIDQLKDIETYILTCGEVSKKIDNVLFKLYGPKVDEKYYQKCVDLVNELQLAGNFIFCGSTSTPEIANNEGDIVLLTSISEAFPFSVIEGMACEKLVISSDVGGTHEVLDGYGFIVQPKNYMEFAEKVIYALENPRICAEIGIDARQKVQNGFRTEDMVENYRNTYYNLAGFSL
ncbi:MAG: GT4 family glycosyltransferase PelF [Desulfuromonadales bacterium]